MTFYLTGWKCVQLRRLKTFWTVTGNDLEVQAFKIRSYMSGVRLKQKTILNPNYSWINTKREWCFWLLVYNNRRGRRSKPKRLSKDLPLHISERNNPKIVRTIKYGKEKNKLFIHCKNHENFDQVCSIFAEIHNNVNEFRNTFLRVRFLNTDFFSSLIFFVCISIILDLLNRGNKAPL